MTCPLQMPQRKDKAFIELQAEWYEKLEKSGFEDIEDTTSPNEFLKRWDSSYFKTQSRAAEFHSKREYFDLACSYRETKMQGFKYILFGKQLDRAVWELHAEGLSLREIAKEVGKNKTIVHNIVKELSKKMLKLKR